MRALACIFNRTQQQLASASDCHFIFLMTEPKTDTGWVAEDQDTWDHDPLSLASALWLPPAWPQEGYGDPILVKPCSPWRPTPLGGGASRCGGKATWVGLVHWCLKMIGDE